MTKSKKGTKEVGLTAGNLQKLITLVRAMGWCIGIPEDISGDEDVGGLVIGDLDFLEGFANISIWIPTSDGLTRIDNKNDKNSNC